MNVTIPYWDINFVSHFITKHAVLTIQKQVKNTPEKYLQGQEFPAGKRNLPQLFTIDLVITAMAITKNDV